MNQDHAVPAPVAEAPGDDRPTTPVPLAQLIRLSLYWFGLSSIFAGLTNINQGRLVFQKLVPEDEVGRALFAIGVGGAIVAMIVQPTIGTISDYTASRWGRRKPYIFIGSLLDVAFLFGIASSNSLVAIAAFIVLLQFSSNVAQGPFQGYVPDLVPGHQVGLASALVGLMQILGNVAGYAIGALAIATGNYFVGTLALGGVELATMLSVVLRVGDGRAAKPRAGRSWLEIARESWGTDVLHERSFVWLVGSRLFILMGFSTLTGLAVIYLQQSFGFGKEATGTNELVVLAIVAVANIVIIVPAARASDRIGRKRMIWLSCGLGAIAVATTALTTSVLLLYAAAGVYGIASGMFLAVDWALMTDIVPKASTGRYMGISNLATGSAGVLAAGVGGVVLDLVNGLAGVGVGPRAALLLAATFFAVGALLLRPVDARRREDVPVPMAVPQLELIGGPPQ